MSPLNDGWAGSSGSGVSGTFTDVYGNLLLSDDVGSDGSQGLGTSERRAILAGVRNGDFLQTPISPDGAITDANPLPAWTWAVVSGTSVEFTSIADPAAGSGRVLRMTMQSGAAGDEAYIEQTVEINGSRGQSYGYKPKFTFLTPSASNNIAVTATAQYLRIDGVATGGAGAGTTVFSAITGPYDLNTTSTIAIVPSDAYFLRLRVGLKRNTAAITDTAYIDLTEVRNIPFADDGAVVATVGGGTPFTLANTGAVATLSLGGAAAPVVALTATGTLITLTGAPVLTPSAPQTLVAATAIVVTRGVTVITAAAPITSTAAPTIADGTDGQEVLIINAGASAITLSDQGTLANSNLRLSSATYAMGTRDNLRLVYIAGLGDWQETARTNVI